ncbi:MAG: ribonuclease P protein component [Nitrospinae bacterium]|nr:ribonuclease P protein component [Nitrospinota bacterium]MBI3814377.1 ribonuclease P protein component [Nitrospinota bacterium]
MGSESFGKNERLLKRWQYKEVYDKGWRVNKGVFVIYGLKNEQGYTRIGISVPKRVGTAVKRNRVKRLVREVFRKIKDKFTEPHDIVIAAKKGAEELSYKDVEKIFLSLIESGAIADTSYRHRQ